MPPAAGSATARMAATKMGQARGRRRTRTLLAPKRDIDEEDIASAAVLSRRIASMPYRMPGTRTVIDYAGASVTGRHREINEDAWGAIESASVFIVADG